MQEQTPSLLFYDICDPDYKDLKLVALGCLLVIQMLYHIYDARQSWYHQGKQKYVVR